MLGPTRHVFGDHRSAIALVLTIVFTIDLLKFFGHDLGLLLAFI